MQKLVNKLVCVLEQVLSDHGLERSRFDIDQRDHIDDFLKHVLDEIAERKGRQTRKRTSFPTSEITCYRRGSRTLARRPECIVFFSDDIHGSAEGFVNSIPDFEIATRMDN